MTYQSLNPATGKLLASFPDLTDAELETKLAAAEACYRTWRLTPFARRAAIIMRASVLLHEQAEHFAQIMTAEMGKKIGEARGEVEFSSNILAYYAKNARTPALPPGSTRTY